MSNLRIRPLFVVLPFGLAACLATSDGLKDDDGNPLPTFDPNAEATACSVSQSIFQPYCTGCHKTGAQAPDLTFDALPNLLDGRYVVPADPTGSLVYRKMSGTMASTEGGVMPPTGTLEDARVAFARRWISEGASFDCEPGEVVDPVRYHAANYAEPAVHGPDLKRGVLDCRQCHGTDLTGGAGPSCDDCHMAQWRTTCTFCHGGTLDTTGAPPRDLSGATELAQLTFGPHPEHVGGARHPAFDCTTCHTKPEDVLTMNHVFDSTPGIAEVHFEQGLSSNGIYNDGVCSNLYCHGNGRNTGTITPFDGARLCDSCHANKTSGRSGWATMSGEHEEHLRHDLDCSECHAATVGTTSNIVGPMLHVNGTPDLEFAPGTITRTNGTCAGTCHGEVHDNERWN